MESPPPAEPTVVKYEPVNAQSSEAEDHKGAVAALPMPTSMQQQHDGVAESSPKFEASPMAIAAAAGFPHSLYSAAAMNGTFWNGTNTESGNGINYMANGNNNNSLDWFAAAAQWSNPYSTVHIQSLRISSIRYFKVCGQFPVRLPSILPTAKHSLSQFQHRWKRHKRLFYWK